MDLKINKRRRQGVKPDQEKRNFLMIFSAFIGSVITIAISFPVIGFLFHPLRKETVHGGEGFVRVGDVADLATGKPQKVTIRSAKMDGWNRFDDIVIGAAWLIKQPGGDVSGMSTICPHLGCGIDWDVQKGLFVCPCHKSIFDVEGKVVSGPAPRAMDTLDIKVEGDAVFVRYRKLRLGTSKKIEV